MSKPEADIGLVGLGVMGQNLVLNMADHGFHVAVYNRTESKAKDFEAASEGGPHESVGGKVTAGGSIENFVASLKRPRKIIILVPAGKATDATIDGLAELLEEGDIIIDGGNAHWSDSDRRFEKLKSKGLRFVGSGVSGGELGARFGPSLMPGGDPEAWKELEPIWTAIAAKVDPKTGKAIEDGAPGKPQGAGRDTDACTAWIGPAGAGHFVKMVHNGIEYVDMQLIAESCDLLQKCAGLTPPDLAEVFKQWNTTELDSYLIEITADVLGQSDPRTGKPFVDVVLDRAGAKGTGQWTAAAALQLGVAAPSIAESVFARSISSVKEQRLAAAEVLNGPDGGHVEDKDKFIDDVRRALYAAKITAYAQGFALIQAASDEFGWDLDMGPIAMIWRGGCIIRARLLEDINQAYGRNKDLANLLVDPAFAEAIHTNAPAWRRVVAAGAMRGVPTPCFGSALSYFDSYRSARLPANIIQAQRDYFGAHTYERVDDERGKFFHIDWPEDGRPEIEG